MNSVPLISICIPTFNREKYLEKCLESIYKGWISDIEIVISDNASNDETERLVARYAEFLPIRYRKNQKNLGFDINCALVVEMARGKYCWILGDDDVVLTDALEEIKAKLMRFQPMILQIGYVQGDECLSPKFSVMSNAADVNADGNVFNLPAYLGSQPNVSLLFAFISSFVFLRSCWDYSIVSKKWIGTKYIHMYQIHNALSLTACPVICSLDKPGLIARGNVPSEVTSKIGEIMWLDARTLADILTTIYKNSPQIKRAFSSVFRKSYPLRTISSVLAQTGKGIDMPTTFALRNLGFSKLDLWTATILGKPFLRKLVLKILRRKLK